MVSAADLRGASWVTCQSIFFCTYPRSSLVREIQSD
jgi:hypothetical protein